MDVASTNLKINQEFDNIINNIIKNKTNGTIYSKSFNTKDLPNHDEYNIAPNTLPQFREIYEPLDNISDPCIYWFELESIEKAEELNGLLNGFRKTNIKGSAYFRSIPTTNKNAGSNVLYLGVRQGGKIGTLTHIVGRINQHLGYYKVGGTQGLQLLHYAQGHDFEITLRVVPFKGLEPMYLYVIEKMLAKELTPLCGRH